MKMRRTFVNYNRDNIDFNVVQYGYENCRSDYTIGNFVRKNYLIHYVYEGCGNFVSEGKTYHIHAGQAFLICPDRDTQYRADTNDPWVYRWVEFSGRMVVNFLSQTTLSLQSPVLKDDEQGSLGRAMQELVDHGSQPPYLLTGRLWMFLGAMLNRSAPRDQQAEYIKEALAHIQTFSYQRVTVSQLADFLGLNRSYFCRIFTERMGITPKDYIQEHRMKSAADLLITTNLSIGTIGNSVGYTNQMNFTRAFTRIFGMSPTHYRKQQRKGSTD